MKSAEEEGEDKETGIATTELRACAATRVWNLYAASSFILDRGLLNPPSL